MGCYLSKNDNDEITIIKNEIDNYMRDFINKYCILGKQYFIPLNILRNAWISYRKQNENLNTMINNIKYKNINIFLPDLYPDIEYDTRNGMCYGITLKSWP